MAIFILRRLLLLVPVGLGVILIVGLLIHAVPGDPVDRITGEYATYQEKEVLRHKLGLDKPIHLQIISYIKNVLRGDLGHSLIYHKKVSTLIFERIGPTIELALLSMLVAILISIPLGIFSAVNANSYIDYTSMGISLLGVSIPNFWLGPILILIFSLQLDLLPVSERLGWASYVLPCLTLGTSLAAVLTRITRTSVLENLGEDYVRTARSKGNPERTVIYKHVLKNSSIPIVTVIGLQFGVLLTGTIITEKIFDWPGLGTLILDGIGNRDYPLVQGCVLIFSASYVLVNLVVDLIYAIMDPRIKVG